MPFTNPERWISIPIIGAMIGIFWKSVDTKKKWIESSLVGYVTTPYCEQRQEIITLRIEKTIQTEIRLLKDETFEYLRAIEKAIKNGQGKE